MVWYERFLPLIFPSHPKSRIERNALIASEDDTWEGFEESEQDPFQNILEGVDVDFDNVLNKIVSSVKKTYENQNNKNHESTKIKNKT